MVSIKNPNPTFTFDQLSKISFGAIDLFATSSTKMSSKLTLARHKIIGQDSDSLEITGKDSDEIQISIIFDNAIEENAYPLKFLNFKNLYEKKTVDLLTLPAGDKYFCVLATFDYTLDTNKRSGVVVNCNFIEKLDVATLGNSLGTLPLPASIPELPTHKLSQAQLAQLTNGQTNLTVIQNINNTINKIKSTITSSFMVGYTAIQPIKSIIKNAWSIIDQIDALGELVKNDAYFIQDALHQVISHYETIAQTFNSKQIKTVFIRQKISTASFLSFYNNSLEDFIKLNPLISDQLFLDNEQVLYFDRGAK